MRLKTQCDGLLLTCLWVTKLMAVGAPHALALLVMTGAASGAPSELVPYAVDSYTRHLWHFDEADPGPVQPVAGIIGSFNLTPENGATLGATSAPGFANAGNTSSGVDSGFRGAVIPVSDVTGSDGAFTFEAIIQTANITDIQQIITMEISGSPTDSRFNSGLMAGCLSSSTLRLLLASNRSTRSSQPMDLTLSCSMSGSTSQSHTMAAKEPPTTFGSSGPASVVHSPPPIRFFPHR